MDGTPSDDGSLIGTPFFRYVIFSLIVHMTVIVAGTVCHG